MASVQASEQELPVYGITGGIIDPGLAAADPELFATVTAVTMTPPIDDSADIQEFEEAVSGYEPDDYEVDALNYLNEWLGVKMLAQATAGLDEITAETVLEAMGTTTFDLGFGYPEMTFSTPLNDTNYRGVYNTEVFVMNYVDGNFSVFDSLDTEEGLLSLGS